MKSRGVTIQMKATEQYFPVVLFIMLYKVPLTSKSVDEILWCDHSNLNGQITAFDLLVEPNLHSVSYLLHSSFDGTQLPTL